MFRIISDRDLKLKVTTEFKRFKKSGLSLNDFFDVTIVFVTKIKNHFRVKAKDLEGKILFVWLPGHYPCPVSSSVSYRVPIEKLSSVTPIKMSLKDIFQIYDITDSFESEFELEDKYNLAIDWYLTDRSQWEDRDLPNHWRSSDLPGFKASGDFRIKLAKDANNETYWIPPSTPSPTQFQCTKFPRICRYEARDAHNLKLHMKRCISDTKLITKKVRIEILLLV